MLYPFYYDKYQVPFDMPYHMFVYMIDIIFILICHILGVFRYDRCYVHFSMKDAMFI